MPWVCDGLARLDLGFGLHACARLELSPTDTLLALSQRQNPAARGVIVLLPRRSDFAIETNIFHVWFSLSRTVNRTPDVCNGPSAGSEGGGEPQLESKPSMPMPHASTTNTHLVSVPLPSRLPSTVALSPSPLPSLLPPFLLSSPSLLPSPSPPLSLSLPTISTLIPDTLMWVRPCPAPYRNDRSALSPIPVRTILNHSKPFYTILNHSTPSYDLYIICIIQTIAMKGELWCLLQAALQAGAMDSVRVLRRHKRARDT